MEINGSNIFIVNDIENTLAQVVANLPMHSSRIIQNEEKSEFLMAQANATIKEAYIATNQTKYIILCGSTFRHEAQNALLKVLEEPPKNVIFIIITTSKSAILPTILSRVPHKYLKKNQEKIECEINFLHLDLKEIYSFLKQNQKSVKH
jgi:DNA polymerase-3 subunit delta'